jgi:hypothetical protein
MFMACYTVQRLDGEWVVSASGAKILTCKNKSIAIKTARCAADLLCRARQQDRPNDAFTSRQGGALGGRVAVGATDRAA